MYIYFSTHAKVSTKKKKKLIKDPNYKKQKIKAT